MQHFHHADARNNSVGCILAPLPPPTARVRLGHCSLTLESTTKRTQQHSKASDFTHLRLTGLPALPPATAQAFSINAHTLRNSIANTNTDTNASANAQNDTNTTTDTDTDNGTDADTDTGA